MGVGLSTCEGGLGLSTKGTAGIAGNEGAKKGFGQAHSGYDLRGFPRGLP